MARFRHLWVSGQCQRLAGFLLRQAKPNESRRSKVPFWDFARVVPTAWPSLTRHAHLDQHFAEPDGSLSAW